MTALLAITARELRARSLLVWAGFAVALLVPLLPLSPDTRSAVASALVAPAAIVLALVTGASVIAGDLASGRLAFFFSRPVAWWAIAGGKLLAALVLTFAGTAAAAIPAMIWRADFSGLLGLRFVGWGTGLAAFWLFAPVLIGLAHALSVVYRSGSRWAALDFALGGATVAGGILLLRAVVRWGVWGLVSPTGRFWLVAFVLLSLAALTPAAVQMARGRSDLQRGHRALSLTLWSGVLLLLAIPLGLLAHQRTVRPDSFASPMVVSASRDGRRIGVVAHDSGVEASFVLDTGTGGWLRVPSRWPRLSADGRTAAWLVPPAFWQDAPPALELVRLDGPRPVVETLDIDRLEPNTGAWVALDAKAERAAVLQIHSLQILELPSGRRLSQTSSDRGEWMGAAFLPDGRFRAFRHVRAIARDGGLVPDQIEVVEFVGGVQERRTTLVGATNATPLSDAAADRVLLREWGGAPRSLSLHDVATGERVWTHTSEVGSAPQDEMLLASGAVAVAEKNLGKNRLLIAADGRPDRVVELPDGLVRLGGEIGAGVLAVALRTPRPDGGGYQHDEGDTLLVSIDRGEILRREAGLVPAAYRFLTADAATVPFFSSQAGWLVRLDAATGARQVVLPAPNKALAAGEAAR